MKYQTEHIDLATDFDAPVCRGTLRALEDRYQLTAKLVGDASDDPILTYWVDGDIDRVCSGEKLGCFIPGTRIVAAYQGALHHEIVHAVLDTRGVNHFVEEGLAEFVGGYPIVYEPRHDASPFDQLSTSREEYIRGGLSYPAAASFTYFLAREGGEQLLEDLVHAVDDDRSAGAIKDIIEDALEDSDDQITEDYRTGMSVVAPGLSRDAIDEMPFDALEGLHRLSIDCDDKDTYGPLDTDSATAYRIFRVQLPRAATVTWRLHGSPEARAWVVPAYDRKRRRALDWLAPDLDRMPSQEIAGEQPFSEVVLARGEHAVIVSAPSQDVHELHLEVRVAEAPGAPPRRSEP